jgi:TonB family protein
MSAELKRVTNTETWTLWANQVVNGTFPLRCFLGGSDHSAVYLTEYKANGLADAAIKFVRADAPQANAQLAQWQAVAALPHPHLVRLFEVGQCQIDGQDLLFVVMEYAEQALAQILQQRALSPEEIRELLVPTLDGLGFLHRNQLVHGHLKPSNILAVNDQLKLTSDTVRSADDSSTRAASGTAYDPPELSDSGMSSAGDIWGLGMTLVEALTLLTATTDQHSETAILPANFPAPFAGMARRCLSLAPANRPTVIELGAPFKPASPARVMAEPQPPAPPARVIAEPRASAPVEPPTAQSASAPTPTQTPTQAQTLPPTQALTPPPTSASTQTTKAPPKVTPPKGFHKRHAVLAAIAAVTLLPLAAWVGLRGSGNAEAELQPTIVLPPAPVAAPVIAKVVETPQPALPPPTTSLTVLNEVMPDVPPAIQAKIRGRVYVTVRLLVDPAGDVIGVLMDNPGPSKYFARLADNAAREWQFAPADDQGPRVWLVRFQFTRDGVATRVTAQ